MIVFIVCVIVFLKLTLLVLICISRGARKQKERQQNREHRYHQLELANLRDALEVMIPADFRFDNGNLKILEKIGEGTYGAVWTGKLTNSKIDSEDYQGILVAAKIRKPTDYLHRELFRNEQMVLKAIRQHPNVLCYLGSISTGVQSVITTEYVEKGNLRDYLISHRNYFENQFTNSELEGETNNLPLNEQPINEIDPNTFRTIDLVSFAYQIANGMKYLASIKCVHRNLTLQSILLANDGTIRISGFQFARKLDKDGFYRNTVDEKDLSFPMWFLAPEWFKKNRFSEKTDIWSFGVCLHEMFTLGGAPDIGEKFKDVQSFLKSGVKRDKPEYCPNEVYDIMVSCWNMKPEERPDFVKCDEDLRSFLEKHDNQTLETIDHNLEEVSKYQRRIIKAMV